jgi:hypothetical protein
MVTTSQPEAILEGQLRECYGRVVYSHKTHEKCADILLERMARVKFWQIVLSAVLSAGFIGAALGTGRVAAILGLVLSVVLLVLNSYMKSYDFGQLAERHRDAARDLWLIRERYLSILVDLAAGTDQFDRIQARRDELLVQLHAVYRGSPSTNYSAYKKAQIALQHLEDMTFKDAEIDAFLPKELRRGSTRTAP